MENNQYCILWTNYHGALVDTIGYLQRDGQLTDVTIVCHTGNKVHAHQLVLAACSTFIRDFLQIQGNSNNKHPIILLPSDIKFEELEAMIEFMYTGQVCIQQEKLPSFIKSAKYLKIKGLEDSTEESDAEEQVSDNEKIKASSNHKRKIFDCYKDDDDSIRMTTVKGKKVKDHRYTQQLDLGQSEDSTKWQLLDRKPVLFPSSLSSVRKLRKKGMSKQPVHLSNNVVCYEQKSVQDQEEQPINKVRKHHYGQLHDDDEYLCTCAARKIWTVNDMAALLQAWNETLDQVPPSYFIRSMSLCRSVAKRLQQKGVRKNWRQCQVKMKNLRREMKSYKRSRNENRQHTEQRKVSEVANACAKFLPSIEDIFTKEESIRKEWYDKKDKQANNANERSIDNSIAHIADSDLADEDTDGVPNETECEETFEESHHRHTVLHGTVVHHIIEPDIMHTKEEPQSATDTEL